MNKTIIIAIVAAVLIGGGLWYALSKGGYSDTDKNEQQQEIVQPQSQETAEKPTEEGEPQLHENQSGEEEPEVAAFEVAYTASGFEPANITINAGDTITWTNESSSAMWVASDDHPIHNDYRGFDQLGNGQTYSFTFEQTGTWSYHNHSNSSQGGTITVN